MFPSETSLTSLFTIKVAGKTCHKSLVSFHFHGYSQSTIYISLNSIEYMYVLEVHSSICKSVDKKMNEGPTLIKTSTKAWSIEIFITYQSKKVAFYFD